MSLAFHAAPYEKESPQQQQTESSSYIRQKRATSANKTQKNDRVAAMIHKLHTTPAPADEYSSAKVEGFQSYSFDDHASFHGTAYQDAYMSEPQTRQYYQQAMAPKPRTTAAAVQPTHSNSYEDKLNYIIHMMEQSKDEKTNSVTEEVVLYCFLGIFTIFCVDSFVKIGRYAR
jgi:hypothetical protein